MTTQTDAQTPSTLTGEPLVEKIRDAAGQKGTGKWTAISGLDFGTPTTLIAESVFARCLSALKVCYVCERECRYA